MVGWVTAARYTKMVLVLLVMMIQKVAHAATNSSLSLITNVEHSQDANSFSYNQLLTVTAQLKCAKSCLATNCGFSVASRIFSLEAGHSKRHCVCLENLDVEFFRHSHISRIFEFTDLRTGKEW